MRKYLIIAALCAFAAPANALTAAQIVAEWDRTHAKEIAAWDRTHAKPSTKSLNANQIRYGCTKDYAGIWCPSPGTGMDWKKGHNPYLGQSAEAYEANIARRGIPLSPDCGKVEGPNCE